MTTAIVVALCFVAGLIAGSFINVVAYRVPAGRSVATPSSACPHCQAPIRPGDNVPILSWFLLRGRCRDCAAPISPRYPIVEATTALLFAATPLLLGVSWVLPAYLWFVAVTVALTLTDLDHKLIPNRILFPGIIGSALLLGGGALLEDALSSFGRALLAAGTYFGGLFVVALVARGGFGFGDVKLAFLLGMFTGYLGWGHLAVAVFLAFLTGGVVSIFLLVTRLRSRKDAIPFGPYLIAGAYLAIALGDEIIDWYVG